MMPSHSCVDFEAEQRATSPSTLVCEPILLHCVVLVDCNALTVATRATAGSILEATSHRYIAS